MATREQLVCALRELVAEQGEGITVQRFAELSGYGTSAVYRHFPGGWAGLRLAAGLPVQRPRKPRVSDTELLLDYRRVCDKLRKVPTFAEYDREGLHCGHLLIRRFGSKRDLMRRYHEFLRSIPELQTRAAKRARDKREQQEMNLVQFVRERWLELAVRFELSSSDFRAEAHTAEQYQLLVCWEHDWPQCPLRVIELRRLLPGRNLTTGEVVSPSQDAA